MMLGVSGLMNSSGDGATTAAEAPDSGGSSEVGGSSSIPGSGAVEESGGGGGGNRWPRQETIALLKIRSDMDVVFRDASLKGPLWEEVSRKMADLGFHRSAKKCKEKFENVYKYHKRTKDGRASKPDGKTYRFFDQLEALENISPNPFTPPTPRAQPPATTTTTAAAPPPPPPAAPAPAPPIITMPTHVTVSSSSPTPLTIIPPQITTNKINFSSPFQQIPTTNVPMSFLSNSTSSSTSSDEDIRRRGRKRKWKDYFEKLMKEVITKQEELHKKFLDSLEKRERDRTVREEAWRIQETARIKREHELLVQERSMAAAKDSALISFLHKFNDQNNLQLQPMQVQVQVQPPQNAAPPAPPGPPQPPPPVTSSSPPPPPAQPPLKTLTTVKTDNGGSENNNNFMIQASPSRWPKAEVEALIKLRTNLDLKYQDNGPKGPLWEEISTAMGKIGYNRSSKRCKEKWENINKYFKKVKESNRKRPEDSKTCPYFHQLDAIYKERAKSDVVVQSFNPGYPNPMPPIMARPEQQWPIPEQKQHEDAIMHDNESDHDEDEDEDEDEDDDDEDVGGSYEIIANKQQSSLTNTVELEKL